MGKIDVNLIREKMVSEEGLKFRQELDDLRLTIEDVESDLSFRKLEYFIRSIEYKRFLGYDLTEQEQKDLDQAVDEMDGYLGLSHESVQSDEEAPF